MSNQATAILPCPAGLVSSNDGSPIVGVVTGFRILGPEGVEIARPIFIDRTGEECEALTYMEWGELSRTRARAEAENSESCDVMAARQDRFRFVTGQAQTTTGDGVAGEA
jgi:hypothetical protein